MSSSIKVGLIQNRRSDGVQTRTCQNDTSINFVLYLNHSHYHHILFVNIIILILTTQNMVNKKLNSKVLII
jgi:hypothetical protein